MEPRVKNLLLNDTQNGERNVYTQALINKTQTTPSAAHFPAIRTLPGADNLNNAEASHADIPNLLNTEWRQPSHTGSPPSTLDTSKQEAPANRTERQIRRPAKSAVPLEQVLNNSSPQGRTDDNILSFDSEPRKKRRLDTGGTRELPKPSVSGKRVSKRQHLQPLLPPLLPPLHEPPPDARIVPSIITEFRAHKPDVPPSEPKPSATIPDRATTLPSNNKIEASLSAPLVQESENVSQRKVDHSEPKKRKKNKRWTEEETRDLLQGVARFGIGSWKKILLHPDYKFNNRTAVDLKDRFRTCCPDEYSKSRSTREPEGKASEDGDKTTESNQQIREQPKKQPGRPDPPAQCRAAEELARLGISGPFPKRQRRERREFNDEEDKALLKGFQKYGAQWKQIRLDPELALSSRSRTDLRDRFRNRYPKQFVDAGYKFRLKESLQNEEGNSNTSKEVSGAVEPQLSSTSLPSEDIDPALICGGQTTAALLDPPLSATKDRLSYSLKFLTESITDPTSQFADLSPDDEDGEDPSTITLSRNIFDWADANISRTPFKTVEPNQLGTSITAVGATVTTTTAAAAAAIAATAATAAQEPKTLSTLDQFHINPLVAPKLPPSSSLNLVNLNAVGGSSTQVLPNQFPQLPLSGILNGPVSLPSASDLMHGIDHVEGK